MKAEPDSLPTWLARTVASASILFESKSFVNLLKVYSYLATVMGAETLQPYYQQNYTGEARIIGVGAVGPVAAENTTG